MASAMNAGETTEVLLIVGCIMMFSVGLLMIMNTLFDMSYFLEVKLRAWILRVTFSYLLLSMYKLLQHFHFRFGVWCWILIDMCPAKEEVSK